MRKKLSNIMLKLHNVSMELSKVRKKVREPPNVRKKIVTCDIGTVQCMDRVVKCEKKK